MALVKSCRCKASAEFPSRAEIASRQLGCNTLLAFCNANQLVQRIFRNSFVVEAVKEQVQSPFSVVYDALEIGLM